MKVLVSWLRELVEVPVGIEALAERLHLAGFELASITPVEPVLGPNGPSSGPDAVIDFEITANRPDALSVSGFAREVQPLAELVRADGHGHQLAQPRHKDLHREAFTVTPSQ